METRWVVAAMVGVIGGSGISTAAQDRALRAELVLDAPVEAVWTLWSTEAGLTSFFAPGARLEPKVDGVFEILFNPGAPPGQRGAEGLRVVAFEPHQRIAFTWSAPPHIPSIREQRTIVDVRMSPASATTTRVVFMHYGWGSGKDWDAAYDYFANAWNTVVLPNLKHRVATGPIDWKQPPKTSPATKSLKHTVLIEPVG